MARIIIDGQSVEVSVDQARRIAHFIGEHQGVIQRKLMTVKEATRRSLIEQGIWQANQGKLQK